MKVPTPAACRFCTASLARDAQLPERRSVSAPLPRPAPARRAMRTRARCGTSPRRSPGDHPARAACTWWARGRGCRTSPRRTSACSSDHPRTRTPKVARPCRRRRGQAGSGHLRIAEVATVVVVAVALGRIDRAIAVGVVGKHCMQALQLWAQLHEGRDRCERAPRVYGLAGTGGSRGWSGCSIGAARRAMLGAPHGRCRAVRCLEWR